MIALDKVAFRYAGHPVFTDLSLEVHSGEMFGILGPNGSGKTTLLKLLRAVIRPEAGEIRVEGAPLARLRRREVAQKIAVVPQAAAPGYPFPVDEFVAMGRYPWKPGWFGLPASGSEVEKALQVTDTSHLAAQRVNTLSGGELQRVLLARALVQDTSILLLDEASSHLDLDHRLAFAHLLKALNRERGVTIVQVSHDLDLAAALCDRVLVLDRQGRIAALGTPAEVYTEEMFHTVFGAEVRIDPHPDTGAPRVCPHFF